MTRLSRFNTRSLTPAAVAVVVRKVRWIFTDTVRQVALTPVETRMPPPSDKRRAWPCLERDYDANEHGEIVPSIRDLRLRLPSGRTSRVGGPALSDLWALQPRHTMDLRRFRSS
jgi:hypothetical protein